MSSPAAHLRTVFSPDGATILDPEHDALVRLNPTGSFIWQSLQAGTSLHDIAHELASKTDVDPALVSNDLRDFVDELKSLRFLED